MDLALRSPRRRTARIAFALGLAFIFGGTAAAAAPTVSASVASDPVGEGRIICTAEAGTQGEVQTPVVRAHADGVHFVVVNPTDEQLVYTIGTGYLPQDPIIEPHQTLHLTTDLFPGRDRVSCGDSSDAEHRPTIPHVEVVDPHQFWQPFGPFACPHGSEGWFTVAPAKHKPILTLVRHQVTGLRPNDQFRLGGYVHSRFRTAMVFRGGSEIMSVAYFRDARNRWQPYGAFGCAGEGLGIRLPPGM
jgi:hypothetical protein